MRVKIHFSAHQEVLEALLSSMGRSDASFRYFYSCGFNCTEVQTHRVKLFCNCDMKRSMCVRILPSMTVWFYFEIFFTINHYDNK
jgi:hypothetical protein